MRKFSYYIDYMGMRLRVVGTHDPEPTAPTECEIDHIYVSTNGNETDIAPVMADEHFDAVVEAVKLICQRRQAA